MEPDDDRDPFDALPDVRDGLTRLERAVLHVLAEARAEFGERHVPTALLYGRVVEYVDVSVQEFQRVLARLAGR
jgi:DNA gyrase/topoisomerase IV subunit A